MTTMTGGRKTRSCWTEWWPKTSAQYCRPTYTACVCVCVCVCVSHIYLYFPVLLLALDECTVNQLWQRTQQSDSHVSLTVIYPDV